MTAANSGRRCLPHVVLTLLAIATLAGCGGGAGSPATGPATGPGTTTPTTYTIGGSVAGLADGQSVVLTQGSEHLTVTANGNFTLATPVAAQGSYEVDITTQPAGQACAISNATGSFVQANVTNVSVVCSTNTYAISGTVTGLPASTQVVLQNNGGDDVTLAADGPFTFVTKIPYNGGYTVTVGHQPVSGTCSVSNGSSMGITADVTNVAVTCSVNTYTLSGTLAGLATGTQLVLQNDNADNLTVSANGTFTFATPIPFEGSWHVSVFTPAAHQVCTVTNAIGFSVQSNISSVQVNCSPQTFTIGGSVSGIASGVQLTLQNNGANALVMNTNGPFTFSTPVAYGSGYSVAVTSQPPGQICGVTNGSGSSVTANVTNVSVSCVTSTFSVAGAATFTVPAGVTSIHLVATGGGGGGGGPGGGFNAGAGGNGGVVTTTLTVVPGSTINLVVGGGGHFGADGGTSYGAGGGGGGASAFDVGAADQVIAGGGGGGGGGANSGSSAGGNGGGAAGAGGDGQAFNSNFTGGGGGSGGNGGAAGSAYGMDVGTPGNAGNGGAGGAGSDNGSTIAGGTGGTSSGTGSGGAGVSLGGGGGGGFGGGGSGVDSSGGGAGGSTGPTGTTYAAAANGGVAGGSSGGVVTNGTSGTDGSIVITVN